MRSCDPGTKAGFGDASGTVPASRSAPGSSGADQRTPLGRMGMDRFLRWFFALVLGAVGGLLLAGLPAQAEAASTVSTYSVPVTTPDTLGAPVALDTDLYVPDARVPPGGFPLLEIFHGGGSTKDNPYDAGHARSFADDGYVVLMYTARGHGDSGGQTSV